MRGVRIDLCSSCCGIWFDLGEVALYLRRMRSSSSIQVPKDACFQVSCSGRGRDCPACSGRTLRAGATSRVPFLVCSACRGVFLPQSTVLGVLENSGREPVVFDPVREALKDVVNMIDNALSIKHDLRFAEGLLDPKEPRKKRRR